MVYIVSQSPITCYKLADWDRNGQNKFIFGFHKLYFTRYIRQYKYKIQKYKVQTCLLRVIYINFKTLAKSYCMTGGMYTIYKIKVFYKRIVYIQILCVLPL